jgi:putative toxin-antitoxin system antitoxin component (TIGR02293 family)
MSYLDVSFDTSGGGMAVAKSPLRRGAKPARAKSPEQKVLGDLWKQVLGKQRPFGSLYSVAPMLRVELVRTGVPPEALGLIAQAMGISKDQLYTTLGVPRATMERKLRERRRLNQDESERVVGIARLVGQVDQVVRESGEPKGFDAARWVAAWLDRPMPALGGVRPGTLMDTGEGREIVAGLVAQIQSAAYA